jgi:uncharacterized protein (DUF433 family)
MNSEYVNKIKAGPIEAYQIGSTRVSLDSVVYSWRQGDSPETIADNFPALTLEQVYGAIAFYLAHQIEIDDYLRQGEAEAEQLKQQWRANNSALYRRLLTLKEVRQKKAA